jgi:uncharacterized protein (TIGR03437 family)
MFRTFVSILAASVVLSAQTMATPQRIAGVPPSTWPIGDGGPATSALLTPSALAWDRSGNLLIADWRNQRIRRLMADGTISTVIPYLTNGVYGMAVDSHGNLYTSVAPASVSDQAHIFEWAPNGSMTETQSPGTMDVSPGIAIDAADNLYITDNAFGTGGFVWKRSPSGTAVKIAGSGAGGVAGNSGPALQVTLGGPHALTFDSAGNLLIVDFSGILRLNPDGTLTRFAQGWEPLRAAGAPDGSVYFVGDYYGIQRWTAAGGVVQFAGTEQQSFSDGCALSGGQRMAKYASMSPADLLLDGAGRLYFADDFIDSGDSGWFYSYTQGRIRRIDPDGSIRTVAGTGSMPPESAPGGPALQAIFHNPEALAVDSGGDVFFAESGSNRVQEVTAGGQFLTVAGTDSPPAGDDSACYSPTGSDVLSGPKGVAVDAAGNLYISDTGNNRILRRTPDGAIATIAGTGTQGETGDGGPAIDAEISSPTSIAVKPDGSIYFVTSFELRRIRTDGVIETPVAPPGIASIAVGLDGNLILGGTDVYKETPGGFYALLRSIGVMAADSSGAIYGPSSDGLTRVSANCGSSTVTFPRGAISQFPQGLANDSQGNIYLTADNSVWRVAAISPPATDTPSVSLNSPGVYNAASNLTVVVSVSQGPFSPPINYAVNDAITGNEILRITGVCMGPLVSVAGSVSGGSLPTALSGTEVRVNGVAAPLLSVQSEEIMAIAPQGISSVGQASIVVVNQGASYSAQLSASPAVPGIFVTKGTQAAAIDQNGSMNGPAHPAAPGSVISLYLTGAGQTNPPSADGVPPSVPLQLALPVTVQVGGVPAEVVYAGTAPGLAGVAQIDVRIPAATAASRAVPIAVSVGGNSRDQAVTIAVDSTASRGPGRRP